MSESVPIACGYGSITAADILADVKEETHRSDLVAADIDSYLVKILIDLSSRYPFLLKTDTGTLTVGGSITLADNLLSIAAVVLDDDPPLEPISFDEYLQENVDGYVVRGKTMYVSEQSSSVTYYLYQSLIHPASSTTIYFGIQFLDAIVAGVVARIYRRNKQYADAREWFGYYEEAIMTLIGEMPVEPRIGKIRSIP